MTGNYSDAYAAAVEELFGIPKRARTPEQFSAWAKRPKKSDAKKPLEKPVIPVTESDQAVLAKAKYESPPTSLRAGAVAVTEGWPEKRQVKRCIQIIRKAVGSLPDVQTLSTNVACTYWEVAPSTLVRWYRKRKTLPPETSLPDRVGENDPKRQRITGKYYARVIRDSDEAVQALKVKLLKKAKEGRANKSRDVEIEFEGGSGTIVATRRRDGGAALEIPEDSPLFQSIRDTTKKLKVVIMVQEIVDEALSIQAFCIPLGPYEQPEHLARLARALAEGAQIVDMTLREALSIDWVDLDERMVWQTAYAHFLREDAEALDSVAMTLRAGRSDIPDSERPVRGKRLM